MKSKILFVSMIFLGLTGCVTAPAPDTSDVAVVSGDSAVRNAEIQLAEAAGSVSQSLNELAEIERATHPPAKLPSPSDPRAIGMGQLATVEWSGPIGSFVKRIATITHYKFHQLGDAPAIPILVSISAKNTPIAYILRDASFQCGNKANIVVYPASKIIELRYAKV